MQVLRTVPAVQYEFNKCRLLFFLLLVLWDGIIHNIIITVGRSCHKVYRESKK